MAFKSIGSGLCVVGLAGPGCGVGIVFNGFLNSISRNPKYRSDIFVMTIDPYLLHTDWVTGRPETVVNW